MCLAALFSSDKSAERKTAPAISATVWIVRCHNSYSPFQELVDDCFVNLSLSPLTLLVNDFMEICRIVTPKKGGRKTTKREERRDSCHDKQLLAGDTWKYRLWRNESSKAMTSLVVSWLNFLFHLWIHPSGDVYAEHSCFTYFAQMYSRRMNQPLEARVEIDPLWRFLFRGRGSVEWAKRRNSILSR